MRLGIKWKKHHDFLVFQRFKSPLCGIQKYPSFLLSHHPCITFGVLGFEIPFLFFVYGVTLNIYRVRVYIRESSIIRTDNKGHYEICHSSVCSSRYSTCRDNYPNG
jgi:hypothetical protein